MKKVLTAAVAVLFFFTMTSAQRTNFGIKAGFNSASIEVDGDEDYDSKSGIHVGGLAHIHISEHFAVQPELVYSCQGGEDLNGKLKLGYINVPILAQYMVNNGFRLQTGPQIGFLVSAEREIGDLHVDVDDAYNSTDISWVFGAGYIFSSGVGIDLRYNLGLSNISDVNTLESRNRVLQLGLFYQFKNNGRRK